MSVRTTADEKLESARSNVDCALADLSAIIIDKAWVVDEHILEAQARFRRAYAALLEAQANIYKVLGSISETPTDVCRIAANLLNSLS